MIQPFTGDIGVFFKQKLDDDTNGIVVTFKLNDLGMINMICLNAPYLYKFQKYIN